MRLNGAKVRTYLVPLQQGRRVLTVQDVTREVKVPRPKHISGNKYHAKKHQQIQKFHKILSPG